MYSVWKVYFKSRVVSPIYIDFKGVVGYPNIVKNIVNLFGERMTELNLNYIDYVVFHMVVLYLLVYYLKLLGNQCLLFEKKPKNMV